MEEISYTRASEELKDIVEKIEQAEIDVDELAALVKRAAELIEICKQKLKATEEEVNRQLESFGEQD